MKLRCALCGTPDKKLFKRGVGMVFGTYGVVCHECVKVWSGMLTDDANDRERDRSGEADETRSGSAEGESPVPERHSPNPLSGDSPNG